MVQHARAYGDYAANLEDSPNVDVGQIFRSVLSIVGKQWDTFFNSVLNQTSRIVVRFVIKMVLLVVSYQILF